jgi:hypothetical protein
MRAGRRLFLACALAAGLPAMAGELLMTGHIESILLQPRGAPGCPGPVRAVALANGATRITVSNGCGCQQTKVDIDRVLMGRPPDEPHKRVATFNSEVGEWCKVELPVGREAVLIDVLDANDLRWFSTERRGDTLFVAPGEIRFIGGVNVRDMPADDDGLVPLDDMLALIRQASDKNYLKNNRN